MTHKRFQKISICRLLSLQFIFWAVCGQGLHFGEHSHSVSFLQNNIAQIASSSETYDVEHCSICSFYQSLQYTLFVPDMLLNEIAFLKQSMYLENRFYVFEGAAGLFLRGPPLLSLS
ncbi:MAG: hypothetical protein LBT05_04110 [Planctomycetaceae bacterium]|jgi:hypothetical protein|nr:hypothetical protein [Planctomycetaceae bacterium]